MKKPGRFIHTIQAGSFPAVILFSHLYSYEQILRILENPVWELGWRSGISSAEDMKKIKDSKAITLSRSVQNGDHVTYYYYIILQHQFDFADWAMVELAHEVVHACQFIFPRILDMEREIEAVAYTHSYIMEKCLRCLRDACK